MLQTRGKHILPEHAVSTKPSARLGGGLTDADAEAEHVRACQRAARQDPNRADEVGMILIDTKLISGLWKAEPNPELLTWINAQTGRATGMDAA